LFRGRAIITPSSQEFDIIRPAKLFSRHFNFAVLTKNTMADQINADPSEEYNDDGSKNPDYVAPKDETESADDTENKVPPDNDDPDSDDEGDFDDTIDPEKPPEIPIRKSVAQHIIARKNSKIEKLQSKIDANGEDDPQPLTPEASNAIAQEINKRLEPLLGKLASDADEAEYQELIQAEPEAAKYAGHIKAYMSHDAWKNVPVTAIYHHLAFKSAQAQGAKKRAAADLEAKQSRSAGRTIPAKDKVGDLPSAEDIENMSDDEFEKSFTRTISTC
jgi:hypothetical protein